MISRTRPRLLDLFCGAGGCSMGYHRAGFDVVGVDVHPQPRYPFEFHQADALEFPLDGFDAIHASPPCQAFSALRHLNPGKEHPDLIAPTRDRLRAASVPYVIENVEGAPLGEGTQLLLLCGTMFRLQTPDGRAEIRRHRLFELGGFTIALRPACQHGQASFSVVGTGAAVAGRKTLCAVGDHPHSAADRHEDRRRVLTVSGDKPNSANTPRKVITVVGHTPESSPRRRTVSVTGATPQANQKFDYGRTYVRETFSVDDARAAMGIDWMPMKSLSQAIPPAYTEFIGRHLLAALAEGAA